MGNSFKLKKKNIESVYQFEETLGTGSFAEVKRAINKQTGDAVAIKIIEKRNLSPQELDTLNEEVEILQKIDHRHIVKLYDIYETKDHLYMVMEILKGGELFDSIVQRGTYSEKEAAALMRQIIGAVEYLHRRGIAHRDLKPENLIYEDDPERNPRALVKITDFGLAKLLGHDELTGLMKTACGTPGYVAPEILKGQEYTEAIDIWSLGVILFILLCGYPPFADEVSSVLYQKIRQGVYSFSSPYWDDISAEAKELVSKMLTVNPLKRISVTKILMDPWFTKMEVSKIRLFKRQYTEKLEAFTGMRKVKRGMTAIVATNRLKGALRGMMPIAPPPRSSSLPENQEDEQKDTPKYFQVLQGGPQSQAAQKAPKRSEIGDTLLLTIIIGETSEEFKVQANLSWNVGRLKELIGELLKTEPCDIVLSFKRTVLQDEQDLAEIPLLQKGSKIICSSLQRMSTSSSKKFSFS